jgi:hypothetical protein
MGMYQVTAGIYGKHEKQRHSLKRSTKAIKVGLRGEECKQVDKRWEML